MELRKDSSPNAENTKSHSLRRSDFSSERLQILQNTHIKPTAPQGTIAATLAAFAMFTQLHQTTVTSKFKGLEFFMKLRNIDSLWHSDEVSKHRQNEHCVKNIIIYFGNLIRLKDLVFVSHKMWLGFISRNVTLCTFCVCVCVSSLGCCFRTVKMEKSCVQKMYCSSATN